MPNVPVSMSGDSSASERSLFDKAVQDEPQDSSSVDAGLEDSSVDQFRPLDSALRDLNPSTDLYRFEVGPSDISPDAVFVDRDGSPSDAGFFTGAVREIFASSGSDVTFAVMMSGEVYLWGYNLSFNDPLAPQPYQPRLVHGFRNIVTMGFSNSNACGVDRDGAVWCIGVGNYQGVLASGDLGTTIRIPERRMDLDRASRVAWAGYDFFAVRSDGALYARNHLHPPYRSYTWTLPAPVVDLSAELFGRYCVVLSDGRVACSGSYISAVEPWLYSEGPRLVAGLTDVTQITTGEGYYCALKRNGTVWCWGTNSLGQTGTPVALAERCFVTRTDGTPSVEIYVSCVRQPRQVEGLANVAEVRAAGARACARLREGTVWCWGYNGSLSGAAPGSAGGLIGDGQPNTEMCESQPWVPPAETPRPVPCRQRPTRVAGLVGATSIALSAGHGCAALSSGQIWCWGDGFLGDGTRMGRTTPVQVIAPR